MAKIFLNGEPTNTNGSLPLYGEKAPDFLLTDKNLMEIRLSDFSGKTLVLNIFPSLDTDVCGSSVRRFNEIAESLPHDVRILCVSADLPFAQSRFCSAEKIDRVTTVSSFRNPEFGRSYGIDILDGPLRGLLARSVVIINPKGLVVYTELVDDIIREPNYERALRALNTSV